MRYASSICAFILLSSIFSFLIFNTTTFADGDNEVTIPKIFIEGDISAMDSKSDKRKVRFKFEDDTQSFESYAKIKLQGSASLAFEKKSYTVDLYDDNSYKDKKNADFGWGKYNKYTLKANWDDKTNARNIVTANIVASINEKYSHFVSSPNYGETDGFPTEVYVNGDFFGLYTLNIPKSDWMFGMDKKSTQNILFSSDWCEESNMFRNKISFDSTWDFELGDDEGYAVSQLNQAIDFVMHSADDDFKQRVNDYFDLDNLLNYYVMAEFADLVDNVGKNMLVGSYDGKKWFLSLFDLNASWGVNSNQLLDYEEQSGINTNLLFERLHKNFPNELANRYFALRKTILTKENIMDKFYEFESKIPKSSIEKDKAKWGEPMGYGISQIEDYLDTRIPYTDQFFYNLYTVNPEVYVRYETDKNNRQAKVILVTNREDIIVDRRESNDYELTFFENGTYKVSCHDWFENYDETFNIEIDSITEQKQNLGPFILTSIMSIFSCIAVIFTGTKTLGRFW